MPRLETMECHVARREQCGSVPDERRRPGAARGPLLRRHKPTRPPLSAIRQRSRDTSSEARPLKRPPDPDVRSQSAEEIAARVSSLSSCSDFSSTDMEGWMTTFKFAELGSRGRMAEEGYVS